VSFCPVNNGLFDRTVTVYRKEKDRVIRQVVENCYLEREDALGRDVGGIRKERKFLLIVPGAAPVCPGDRIFDGVGPEISPEQWAEFIPVKVQEVMEVSYTKPYYWQGQLCHIEAGGR